ncbi:MAG: hypothetical protein D6736_00325 [Nitrospinota bacterium]|nr:MAG: hypothetical protein D6736_00325 [Nitrospinota bacterium]
MKRTACIASILLCLTLFLWSGTGEGTLPENPLRGFRVFVDKQCVICHPLPFSDSQQYKIGPPLGRRGLHQSLMQIMAAMWNHATEMQEKMRLLHVPAVSMTSEEMEELLAFIYFLGYFDDPGNPSLGKLVFREKGCSQCHVVGKSGETDKIPLDALARYASPIQIACAMWNHVRPEGEKGEKWEEQWPHFQGEEVNDLVAYIWEASNSRPHTKELILAPNPRQGAIVFQKKGCDACHAVSPKEEGKLGPNLANSHLQESASQLAARLWTHGPKMLKAMEELGLERPRFSEQEIADLLAYLYFLPYREEEGDPKQGEILFTIKGCSNCHSIRGKGGDSAPDLAQSDQIRSAIDIARAMWNHAPVMIQLLAEEYLRPLPTFQAREMADLLSYLQTVGKQAE